MWGEAKHARDIGTLFKTLEWLVFTPALMREEEGKSTTKGGV